MRAQNFAFFVVDEGQDLGEQFFAIVAEEFVVGHGVTPGATASDSHMLRETLAHLEEKLAPQHFIRVRKSAIVNGACISEIRPMFDGVYDIVLAEGTVVTSSRRYAHKLRALLES